MKIAVLQFNPQIGQIAANFSRAESLLMREEREGVLDGIELLVLPELAFTGTAPQNHGRKAPQMPASEGYNHPSLAAIAPYLEPTAAGPSTRWAARTATRLKCTVAVGYPEATEEGNFNTAFDAKITAEEGSVAYNSMVIVDSTGEVVGHYRKSFLYYTDETWAKEGQGFFSGVVPIGGSGQRLKAVAGICMDINPYKFESPWTAYEFANHARESRAKIVILSMAWLTHLSVQELKDQRLIPDTNTVGYWVERLRPLMDPTTGADEEVVVICANRTGLEGICPRIGEVKYAGSSCVFSLKKGQDVRIWDILGRAQDGVLVIDTRKPAGFSIAFRKETETAGPSSEQPED